MTDHLRRSAIRLEYLARTVCRRTKWLVIWEKYLRSHKIRLGRLSIWLESGAKTVEWLQISIGSQVMHSLVPSDELLMPPDGSLVPPNGSLVPTEEVPVPPDGLLMPPNVVLMPFDGRLLPPDEFLVPAKAFQMPSDESPVRSKVILVRPDEFRMPSDGIPMASNARRLGGMPSALRRHVHPKPRV